MSTNDGFQPEMQDPARWQRLRELVELETGMDFSGNRITRLRDAVSKVLAADDKADSLDAMLAAPHRQGDFLERLTAELTIGETFFFRNKYHFQALREHVLPRILEENANKREIRVWTAGCSTGEEPYSLAILLDQMLTTLSKWKVRILATDLNREFLERAREGCYRPWSFRLTDVNGNGKYFSREGKNYRLTPHVRHLVRFSYLNLVKDVYPSSLTGTLGLDLILFRNVAIYMKLDIFKIVIQRFHRALRPGGWLLLGESEVGAAPTEGFEVYRLDGATLFRKKMENEEVKKIVAPVSSSPLAAAFLKRQPTEGTDATSLPNWVPLPKVARISADRDTPSPAEQINKSIQQRSLADAERIVDRLASRRHRAKARFRYVQQLLVCGENRRAREMLAKCLEDEPLLIEAQLLKATFAEEDGDLDEAEQSYRRALYVDRKCAIAHFQLALVQRQKGDICEARRSLDVAIALTSGEDVHEAVPYGEGVCYGRLREMIEGVLHISR